MKRKKSTQSYYYITIFAIILSLAYTFADCSGTSNKKQQESKWNKPNEDASYVTRESAEDVQSVEATTAVTPTPSQTETGIEDEIAGDGSSRLFINDLEMPAEYTSASSEIILCKSAFTISYNTRTNCPNYVAWHLTADRVDGNVQRKDKFDVDYSLGSALQVTTQDYSNSGYDRGHMCPAADNKHDERAMTESFYMTNICPQSHNLNAGDWKELEEQCRHWVKDYGDLYIVAGPIFNSKKPATIGKRKNMKIAVPDRFFKVVLMMEPQPKAIGFIYPNEATNKEMRSYSVSVDEVERITGIDFYHNLPDDIERKVERANNPAEWGI